MAVAVGGFVMLSLTVGGCSLIFQQCARDKSEAPQDDVSMSYNPPSSAEHPHNVVHLVEHDVSCE